MNYQNKPHPRRQSWGGPCPEGEMHVGGEGGGEADLGHGAPGVGGWPEQTGDSTLEGPLEEGWLGSAWEGKGMVRYP